MLGPYGGERAAKVARGPSGVVPVFCYFSVPQRTRSPTHGEMKPERGPLPTFPPDDYVSRTGRRTSLLSSCAQDQDEADDMDPLPGGRAW